MSTLHRHKMDEADKCLAYIRGGRGRFTIVSRKTGERFTYRVSKPKDDSLNGRTPLFIKVLTGGDNENAYTYLGCIWPEGFAHGKKSTISTDAKSYTAFDWAYRYIQRLAETGQSLDETDLEFWHEGRCSKCGRALTVPESIEAGMGPVCAGREQ